MQANQVSGAASQSKTRVLVVLCLAVAGIVIVTSFVVRGRGALPEKGPQGVTKVNLSVQDGRPLAKAIETLEAKYGWVITYEDPRYVHLSEIADVTEMVRNPLHKSTPGSEATRVLVPKGGALVIDYDVMSDTGLPVDREAVIQQLLEANSVYGNAGSFRLERKGQVLHVIPTAAKSSTGKLAAQESVLDTVISLPAEERSAMQTLDAICAAVSQATKTQVVVGMVPLNRFFQHRDQEGATSETARDVLLKLLERTGTNLSWQLFYEPGIRMYALNIHQVGPTNRYATKENPN